MLNDTMHEGLKEAILHKEAPPPENKPESKEVFRPWRPQKTKNYKLKP